MPDDMGDIKVRLPLFECLRCGHKWHPKEERVPLCCGFCKSPRWRMAPKEPSESLKRHQNECKSCNMNP